MMRFFDTITLASTKLRTHRVRTGLTVGVGGILFGLLCGVAVVAQGVFSSIESFSEEGLNSRYVMSLSSNQGSYSVYEFEKDAEFIAQVETAHRQLVAKKIAAAKKYNVPYDPIHEDPSPIVVDSSSGKKQLADGSWGNQIVTQAAETYSQTVKSPFDPKAYIRKYSSASLIGKGDPLVPADGTLTYMKNSKERVLNESERRTASMGFIGDSEAERALAVLPQTLAEPFVSSTAYDPLSGELPVVLPYRDAERLLGLEPLSTSASSAEQRNRVADVRSRIDEVTVSFCYRNTASLARLAQAQSTAEEIKANSSKSDYQRPSLVYKVPSEGSCGAVAIESDTRTAEEKRLADQYVLFEKEVGSYIGDPEQHKLVFRGVGISADTPSMESVWSIAGLVQSALTTPLGWNTWNIPEGLLSKAPASQRPAAVFDTPSGMTYFQNYYIELTDKDQAVALLKTAGLLGGQYNETQEAHAYPFGSNSLLIEEGKRLFDKVLFWAMIIVGAVATLILSGIVGRTIADGRRETAVFRAIGATRGNMASVYTVYTLLFSLRIVIFALVLGAILAVGVHMWGSEAATIGAQLAFSAADIERQFYLFNFQTGYVAIIVVTIIAAGLLASIIPLLRNIRRNPIRDMREE